jgi:cytochrome o ubiquinol oxidase subunit IV
MQPDHAPDFGTGQKKLGIYSIGFIACVLLTVIAFATVISARFTPMVTLAIIFIAACLQFFVQILCFLRLNVATEQGKINVMSFVFTGVILVSIIAGSLWIMWNCNYYMSH